MDGEDTHATAGGIGIALPFGLGLECDFAFVRRRVVGGAQLAQFVEEARQARVAPTVEVERQLQQGVEVGRDARPLGLGYRQAVTGDDLALMVNAVDQVVRRQARGKRQPFTQQPVRPR